MPESLTDALQLMFGYGQQAEVTPEVTTEQPAEEVISPEEIEAQQEEAFDRDPLAMAT